MDIIELNRRFLWNSFNKTNFELIPTSSDVIVCVTNAKTPTITLFDAKGLSNDERTELARTYGIAITIGCNYKYDIVKVIGNTYFLN